MAGEKEVIIYDIIDKKEFIFISLKRACDFLNTEKYIISRHIKKQKIYKNRYIIKYTGIKSAHNNFIYDTNDIISDNKGKILILSRTIKDNKLAYNYKCLLCGYTGIIEQCKLKKQKCSICCKNPKIINKINCINTTCPWVTKYLKDKSDGEKYTKGSSKKILFKCPICGKEKYCSIEKVINRGFSCSYCSEGISYPNKLMQEILKELNIDFICEKRFEWLPSKRYDFYIESKNIIIEMDGLQHTCEENKKNDKFKDEMAYKNGIEKVIRVKSYESNYKFIEDELYKINFFETLNLPRINIKECDIKIKEKSLLYSDILKLWKNGYSVTEIALNLNIKKCTIRKYVKKLHDIGKIEYNGKKEINRETRKKVYDKLTKKTYESILGCSKALKISRDTIRNNRKNRFILINN